MILQKEKLAKLPGASLMCFTITLYFIRLQFGPLSNQSTAPDIRFEINYKIIHTDIKGNEQIWNSERGRDTFCINSLLEETVVNYDVQNDDIEIDFSNGERLKILIDPFHKGESYIVHLSATDWIVVW